MPATGNPRAVALVGLLGAALVLALAGTATVVGADPRPRDPSVTVRSDPNLAGRAPVPLSALPTPRTAQPQVVARFAVARPAPAAATSP